MAKESQVEYEAKLDDAHKLIRRLHRENDEQRKEVLSNFHFCYQRAVLKFEVAVILNMLVNIGLTDPAHRDIWIACFR